MKTISQIRKNNKQKNDDQKNNDQKIRPGKRVLSGLLLLLVAFSLFFYRDSFREIWEGIGQVTGKELCISMLLAGMGYVLEGMTIFCMMGAVIPGPRIRDGIFIAFVCEFYRLTTLGNGSGVAEIHYLCSCGMGKKNAFSVEESGKEGASEEEKITPGSATVLTMIQYMKKRIAIAGLGLCGFFILCQEENTRELCREYAAFVGIGCLITAGIILVFLLLSLSDHVAAGAFWVIDWLSLKISSGKENFRKWKEEIGLLNRSGKIVLRQKKRMLSAVFIQMGKLLLFYGIVAYLFAGKTSLGAVGCIFLMALSFMLSGVIPTPSGAGALEFVFLLFFTGFADGGTAVIVILLFRFVTWICPAAVGGILLIVQKIRRQRKPDCICPEKMV